MISATLALTLVLPAATAQQMTAKPAPAAAVRTVPTDLPPDYRIGAEDVLDIVFWREKDLSAEVVVRPDGKIALPLLNDLQAAGLTPVELRATLLEAARKYVADPNVTVVVKQINSRKVFITGEVEKPGTYPLGGPTTVMQLIAMAGGLKEYAKGGRILVMRVEAGRQVAYRFSYSDILKRVRLSQNIQLKPGDTVVVP